MPGQLSWPAATEPDRSFAKCLAVGFPGGTYERMFYVADVELQGPIANHELHVALDEADLLRRVSARGTRQACA